MISRLEFNHFQSGDCQSPMRVCHFDERSEQKSAENRDASLLMTCKCVTSVTISILTSICASLSILVQETTVQTALRLFQDARPPNFHRRVRAEPFPRRDACARLPIAHYLVRTTATHERAVGTFSKGDEATFTFLTADGGRDVRLGFD